MATRNHVPRATGEGLIGTSLKRWLGGYLRNLTLGTGGAADAKITFDHGAGASNPYLGLDDTRGKIVVAQDGVTKIPLVFPFHDAYRKAGFWYTMPRTFYYFGDDSFTANYIYAIPFIVAVPETFDRIGIEVSTAAAGNARLGIYDNANMYPGNLVLDAGQIDTGTTGEKIITISQALEPGLYWLVIHPSVTIGTHSLNVFSLIIVIGSDAMGSSGCTFYAYNRGSYSALPATFPGGATFGWPNPPAIMMRRA